MTTDQITAENDIVTTHDTESHDAHGHDDHEHHSSADLDMFGFWVYIMSDCLLFATLFATFAVLSMGPTGAINPAEVLKLDFVAWETALLLASSFTFGMAMLGAYAKKIKVMATWLVITWLLGFGFICMELYEFNHLLHIGASPQSSGYWSAFFGLIGTHGLHVTAGLLWMIVMFFHFKRDGLSENNMIRLSMLSLFWHFLDIIWVCVYSFVYLRGAL